MTIQVGKVRKLIGLRRGLPHVRQADQYRDRGEWIDAVVGYRRGLELMPWREDLKVQIGNCLKEYGDYDGAVRAYRSVVGIPNSIEAHAQIADVNRRAGNIVLPYAIASEPSEVADTPLTLPAVVTPSSLPNRLGIDRSLDRRWLGTLGFVNTVNPRRRSTSFAAIKLDQVGAMSLARDRQSEPVLAGVIAVRGRIMSFSRIASVDIVQGYGAGETLIATVPVSEVESASGPFRLFVFNAWIDSARMAAGRSWLAIKVTRKARIPSTGLFVNVIAADAAAPEFLSSNSFVPSPTSSGSLEHSIAEARAEIRPTSRSLFDRPIRSILVIRADQLGDLSATLPAWRRIRELFPEAKITALVQPAVAAVVAASGLADQIETITLAYDANSERRHLAVAEEQRVQARLGRYDLAIDLCPGNETRPLLLLCEAVYLVGFEPDRFPFLDFGISVRSRDKVNRLEKLSHAAHVASLAEALAIAVAPNCGTVPRVDSATGALAPYHLEPGGYAVLHTGARHALNQWPLANFGALAAMILKHSPLAVAIFGEPGDWIAPMLAAYGARIQLLPVLDPDGFDQIISSARVMIGNDSGPKHLAAVRGVPTVSIHVGRLNWNEWGQEGTGAIVAKRVPCAGCGLNDIDLCGREAVCLRSIAVEDVFEATRPYLAS